MEFFDIKSELARRDLPDLFTLVNGTQVTAENVGARRSEIMDILQNEIYGKMPASPQSIDFEITEYDDKRCCAGKAIYKKVRITFPVGKGTFSFFVRCMFPKHIERPPFVTVINFRDNVPDEYVPAEELIDRGIAFGVFCHKSDITSDDGNFRDKLASLFYPDGERSNDTDCGKIAMWSYCASRVLDYVLVNEKIDVAKIAVAGHSRLGKTALLTAAFDERYTCAYSNDSGCAGAALTRGKVGEDVEAITRVFPFWFCGNYKKYANKEHGIPFDQHFLVAAIAPRKVYIASAVEDLWADPLSEYLTCCAAGDFWTLYGKETFPFENVKPRPNMRIFGENIGYHIRHGVHYWSRHDWNEFLDFFLGYQKY